MLARDGMKNKKHGGFNMKKVITGFQEVQDRERLMIEGGYAGFWNAGWDYQFPSHLL
ncbi:hypothetical protein [Spirochaeta africana]|uniref:Uncharacterized protein n=1 Tax=Spirochaeta africana (strain ATCC 700263 / DSM 8902 / Z-7692) TaxID=889378 RepID=H9UH65_SPIAZ|nr:hypothetical protein [Spirochaeta africana]AFG36858.1 hypothetical protein Spiaf_0763 [Spirochaeta africana DSM 8902]